MHITSLKHFIRKNYRKFAENPSSFFVVVVVLSWIGCSSITQVSNIKYLLVNSSPVFLVFCQMCFGAIVYRLLSKRNVETYEHLTQQNDDIVDNEKTTNLHTKPCHYWLLLAGFCNALGHTLTMYSMLLVSPALPHVVRSTEPIFLSGLSYFLLNKKTTAFQFVSLLPMIAGIVFISTGHGKHVEEEKNTFVSAILLSLVATIFMALRNCATKKHTQVTTLGVEYPQICEESLKFMAPALILEMLLDWCTLPYLRIELTRYLPIAVFFHVAYSSLSFYVLSLTDPLSHSVIKISSRAFSSMMLGLLFGIQLQRQMVFGVFLCATGAWMYAISSHKFRGKYIAMIAGPIFAITFVLLPSGGKSIQDSPSWTIQTGTIVQLQVEALHEIGLYNTNNPGIPYPVIPISGYRQCLKTIYPKYEKPANNTILYWGVNDDVCSGCNEVDRTKLFAELSNDICLCQKLICGAGSTFVCGLIGLSTRTIVEVNTTEFQSWPAFMQDFNFADHSASGIEHNHRILFARHTIPQSSPLLKVRYNLGKYKSNFNVMLWVDSKFYNRADITSPLEEGNIGDILGSHLGSYFGKKLGLTMYVYRAHDLRGRHIPMSVSVALIGSIAKDVLVIPRTVLLGVGTITHNHLTANPTSLSKNVYVMCVRGPRTRDAFINKYGLNPEIIGDPGIMMPTLFKEEVAAARASKSKRKKLCFISHEAETKIFQEVLSTYQNITISMAGHRQNVINSILACEAIASSSLHGVIFAHSLSIPVAAIHLSNKVAGNDWKFYDYYLGMNVTSFNGLHDARNNMPATEEEWLKLIQEFPRPDFPMDIERHFIFERFKSIFT